MDESPSQAVIVSDALQRLRREVATIRDIADAEATDAIATNKRLVDRHAAVILLVAALSLTCGQFLARDSIWIEHAVRLVGARGVASRLHDAMTTSSHAEFWQLMQWACVQVASYTVGPIIVAHFVLHIRLRDLGLRVRGIGRFAMPYVMMLLVSLPFLIAVANTGEFQSRYPFYKLAAGEGFWPYLWVWWIAYAIQFAALEFFFRGFLMHGLVPRFGYLAVFVMAVPYNMLHFGKPMPEALAAIVGALVLGTLAIRTRSIWWGAALHISIAATMDLLSLWHQHRIF